MQQMKSMQMCSRRTYWQQGLGVGRSAAAAVQVQVLCVVAFWLLLEVLLLAWLR
jgi:hypothetical protein